MNYKTIIIILFALVAIMLVIIALTGQVKEVKSVEGTKDVQLTKEAIQSGSNVVVKAPVPVVTYYDDTIIFLSNGDTTGTEFEGQDVYYEYVFDIVSKNEEDKSKECNDGV